VVQRPSYISVPGSDKLRTRARGHSDAAVVEAAAPSSLKRVAIDAPLGNIVVGPALLQGRQVPLLVDVMDRLGPLLSPEAFVVYLQLYRLAVADGKNVTRLSLSELSRRCRLQGRRLNKAIADAVGAGVIALVDRTRDGTLYRVRLPSEVLGDDDGATALPAPAPVVKRAATKATPTPTPKSSPKPTKAKASSSPSSAPSSSSLAASAPSASPRSVGDICRWFEAAYGNTPGRRGPDVASAVMALLEDGKTFAVIPEILSAFVEAAPKSAPLADLGRYRGS
jgi:hypothetical protein